MTFGRGYHALKICEKQGQNLKIFEAVLAKNLFQVVKRFCIKGSKLYSTWVVGVEEGLFVRHQIRLGVNQVDDVLVRRRVGNRVSIDYTDGRVAVLLVLYLSGPPVLLVLQTVIQRLDGLLKELEGLLLLGAQVFQSIILL